MLHHSPHDMGDHPAAHHDEHGDGQCDCSIANAQETHMLVCALAEEHGYDLCDPSDVGADEPDDIANLRLVHDLAMAHGASCDYDGSEDMDDDHDHEVTQFSDDDSDDSDDDVLNLDLDELDNVEDDGDGADEAFSDDDEAIDADELAEFREWTKTKRDDTPEEDFGEPESRGFPVTTQADLDSAAHLIGKAADPEKTKARLIRIAKRKGLSIPEAWKETSKVTMSALDLVVTPAFTFG